MLVSTEWVSRPVTLRSIANPLRTSRLDFVFTVRVARFSQGASGFFSARPFAVGPVVIEWVSRPETLRPHGESIAHFAVRFFLPQGRQGFCIQRRISLNANLTEKMSNCLNCGTGFFWKHDSIKIFDIWNRNTVSKPRFDNQVTDNSKIKIIHCLCTLYIVPSTILLFLILDTVNPATCYSKMVIGFLVIP